MENITPQYTIVATDVVIMTIKDGELVARMMKVHRPPYYDNQYGFPGGLILVNETAEQAALRIVKERAKLREHSMYLEQLQTFSELNRDKRGKVVSISYLALVPWEELEGAERDSDDELAWMPLKKLKNLAYDHNDMLRVAKERLSSRVTYTTLIAKIMQKEFTLTELEKAFELVSGKSLDKRNFRKKIEKLSVLTDLKKKTEGVKHRPAKLHKFTSEKVVILEML